MTLGAFLFGKLPSHGDFVSRGLSGAAQRAWDERCTTALSRARARPDVDVEQVLHRIPPCAFVIDPLPDEDYLQLGCAAASRDRVSRPFLFVLGLTSVGLPRPSAMELAAALEPCLYDAMLARRSLDAVLDDVLTVAATPSDEGTPTTPVSAWNADWIADAARHYAQERP